MDSQKEVIDFLMNPATHGGAAVTHVETHGAHVFLAGETALKIKRAVRYSYMDFSTLDARAAALRRELALNRPAAPQIYRDVVPITRTADGLAIGGAGEPVEWVLRMARFDTGNELAAIAARGGLTPDLCADLGRVIADYHARAPRRSADGAALIAAIVAELDEALASMTAELGAARVARFGAAARSGLDALAGFLSERGRAGAVRRCHGDLHLRNIVLIDGRPVLFDALEFDETLGTCDILYDLAFLLMDLCHRGLDAAANMVLASWLDAQDGAEDDGLRALPLFLAIRAAIRAMVDVQTDAAAHRGGSLRAEARAYLDQALAALDPPAPRLVAVGGLSGSGETSVARGLAPRIGACPGAIHLRSDLERKRLAGVDPLTRLPDRAYTAAANRAVRERLLRRAETLLAAGRSVLIDATWLAPADRRAAEDLAARLGLRFTGLWLDAPQAVLAARVTARRGDASDADAAVVARQAARDPGPLDWRRVDASGSPEATLAAALAALA